MEYIGDIKILFDIESVFEDKNGNLFFRNRYDGKYIDANWIDKSEIFNVFGPVFNKDGLKWIY